MGTAKELMVELQLERAVAAALGLQPQNLRGYDYEIREDGFRTLIVWADEAPDGVTTDDEGGELITEVDLSEPEGPED